MGMPGFTAEASLWRSTARYWMHRVEAAPMSGVLPALPNPQGCKLMCAQAAECVLHPSRSPYCQMYRYICEYCLWDIGAICVYDCIILGGNPKQCIQYCPSG